MSDIGVCVCILGWQIAQPLLFIAGLIVVFFFWAGADGATGAGDWLILVVAVPPPHTHTFLYSSALWCEQLCGFHVWGCIRTPPFSLFSKSSLPGEPSALYPALY